MGGFQQKSREVVSIGLTSKACINSEIMFVLLFSFFRLIYFQAIYNTINKY